MAKKKKTSVVKSKNLRQVLFPDKTAVINFDPDNILSITYNPSTLHTIVEDKPDNLRSEFTLGQAANLIDKNISANGTYNASDDSADGYKKVVVNVSSSGYDLLDIVTRTEPSGAVVLDSDSNFNVRTYIFQGCAGITSFSSNKAKEIQGYAFQNCSNMTSVNCPNCTKLEQSVFEGCSKLTNITLSNSYSVAGNCFRNCTLLQDFECWASGTSSTMFYGDTSLRFVDFKNLNLYRLESNCFQNCSALVTLVLRKTSDVVGLAAVSAFNGTPFANGGSGGTIYVPSALLSTYPTSTNWSTVNGYGTITWKAIEGSIYE